MFDLETAVRKNIWALKPYRCARDDYSTGILLDANENSFGPAIPQHELPLEKLERYPDPYQNDLKLRLAKLRNLDSTDYFYLGVGSDECIDMAIRVFAQPGKEKILITPPTYGMYSVCAQVNDIQVVKVPLLVDHSEPGTSFQLDVQNILNTIDSDPLIKIVFLCSPGNPTGTLLKHEDIKRILDHESYNGIVFVDEAYIDFSDDYSIASWVLKYPNLIISQTLSKSFGLAGIRLSLLNRMGFTIAPKDITQIFNRTKAPYNISSLTSNAALSALSDQGIALMRQNISSIKVQRDIMIKVISKLDYVGRILGANDANFVLVEIIKDGEPNNDLAFHIYKRMAEIDKVVTRFRGSEHGCSGCLRISVGTGVEVNQLFLNLSCSMKE